MNRHGTIVAYLALFVALGGTALAGGSLLTGRDIRNNSLTGKDINEAKLHPDLETRTVYTPLVVGSNGFAEATASCGDGEQVLSGGFHVATPVRESGAYLFPGQSEGWYVRADAVPGTTKQGLAEALCARAPGP